MQPAIHTAASADGPADAKPVETDPKRPRLLVQTARHAAAAMVRRDRVPPATERERLARLEAEREAARRARPFAWRVAPHVTLLAAVMAIDARAAAEARLEAQLKASGSDALRSAT
ncbi:MAG: DUF6477 family protein [Pseudomonadota bacterium]